MDFQTAVELSKLIEEKEPNLVVIGFRRMRPEAVDSWAIDVMDTRTEKTATVDEKDLWEARIAEIAAN
jgi:hypothetical protein